METLRTRIRVARNMVVLTPVLTVSAIIGDWPPHSKPHPGMLPHPDMQMTGAAMLFPLVELVALISAVVVARWLKGPRTSPPPTTSPTRSSWLASAVAVWFGLHVLAAAIVFRGDPATAACAIAAGFLFTTLAALTWKQMSVSFMTLLWNHGRFIDPEGLAAHMRSGST